jgi:tetratricopeptide (TPR) repeat protein
VDVSDPALQQHAEQVALQVALQRGFLDANGLAQARQVAAQPGAPPLLTVLTQRFLNPEHAAALGQVYQQALQPAAPGVPLEGDERTLIQPVDASSVIPLPSPPGSASFSRAGLAPTAGAFAPSQTLPVSPPSFPTHAFASEGAAVRGVPSGPARAGSTLGPYHLIRELARGGMGVVYEAERPGLDRRVALKQLLCGADTSDTGVERFLIEARIAARLRHPNIVGIHDVGQVDGQPYFAMDLIEGEDLGDRIRREGPLPPTLAAQITRKLADALAYAHERSVLHRDIKPANVLVSTEGEPVLTDFGLAKDVGEGEDSGLTQAGAIMGTPSYMPPEQAAGDKDLIDRRADVYSLGATLYAMLTGRPPFEGTTILNTITKVVSQPVEPPRKLRPEIARDLEVICLACLAKDPVDRYATAKDLAEDLRRYLAHEPILARPPSLGDRLGKWVRRNRALTGLAGVGAVLLVLAAVGVFLGVRAGEVHAARLEAEREIARLGELADESADTRLGQALVALQAAGRYRAAAGEEARPTYVRALQALGEAALAGRQLALAQQAYEQAVALVPDDASVAEKLQDVARRRTERRDAVREILGAVLAGDAERFVQDSDPVFELVRYPEERDLLCESLDTVSSRLLDLQIEFLGQAKVSSPGLEAELEEFRKVCAGGERLASADIEKRYPLLNGARAWHVKQAIRGDRRFSFAQVLRNYLGSRCESERRLASIVCQALGRIGADARDAVPYLQRFLAVEPNEAPAIDACVALARIGTKVALDALAPHRGRLHDMRLELLVGRAAQRLGLQDETVDGQSSVEELILKSNNSLAVNNLPQGLGFCTQALAQEPENPLALAHRAHLLALSGEVAKAKQDLLLLFKSGSDLDHRVLTRAGLARIQLTEYELAATHLAKAIELIDDPDQKIKVWLPYTDVLLALGRVKEGEEQIRQILELGPNAGAYAKKTMIHIVRGELTLAAAAATRAAELDPKDPDAILALARVAFHSRKYAMAAPLYDKVLKSRVTDAQVLSERGVVRGGLGDVAGAEDDFKRALALTRVPTGRAMILMNRAKLFGESGRVEEAIKDLERSVELHPQNAAAWAGLGQFQFMKDDLKGALLAAQRSLEIAAHPQALALRAKLFVLEGKYAAALKFFDHAVRLAPERGEIRTDRAGTLAQLGRLGEAVGELNRVLKKNPSSIPALRTRAQLLAALGKIREAQADARTLTQLAPEDMETHFVNAVVAYQRKEHRLALESIGKALALQPRDPRSLNLRADCLRLLGRSAEAIKDLKIMEEIAPQAAQTQLMLGAAYDESKQPALAKKHLHRFLELAPAGDPNRAAVKQLLEKLGG